MQGFKASEATDGIQMATSKRVSSAPASHCEVGSLEAKTAVSWKYQTGGNQVMNIKALQVIDGDVLGSILVFFH